MRGESGRERESNATFGGGGGDGRVANGRRKRQEVKEEGEREGGRQIGRPILPFRDRSVHNEVLERRHADEDGRGGTPEVTREETQT